jgi:hypothetical protein
MIDVEEPLLGLVPMVVNLEYPSELLFEQLKSFYFDYFFGHAFIETDSLVLQLNDHVFIRIF